MNEPESKAKAFQDNKACLLEHAIGFGAFTALIEAAGIGMHVTPLTVFGIATLGLGIKCFSDYKHYVRNHSEYNP